MNKTVKTGLIYSDAPEETKIANKYKSNQQFILAIYLIILQLYYLNF